MRKSVLLYISFLFSFSFHAQDRILDSLTQLYKRSQDTVKVQLLCKMSRYTESNDPNRSITLSDSALRLATRIGYPMGIALGLRNLGSSLCTAGRYDESITQHLKALRIFEKHKSKKFITGTYNSMANAYLGLRDNEKALHYFQKSLSLAKEEPVDEPMVAVASFGIANMLIENFRFKDALKYYHTALKSFQAANNEGNAAMTMMMIGETCQRDSNYAEAEKYFVMVEPMFRKLNNEYALSLTLANMANMQMHKKNYTQAERLYRESLDLNIKRKAWDNIKTSAAGLSQALEAQNKSNEALKYYKIYMQYKDSVINIERNKAIAEAESHYQSEKKEQQIKLQNAELEKSHLRVKQRNVLLYVFAGAGIIVLVFLTLLYREFRQKKKANLLLTNKNIEIERQKELIEERNKDITDSINYAKHIQLAILPTEKKFKHHFPSSFVIFKPKDIVSGDFYLVEEVVGMVYLAVIDCTGHGVPGAMLSVFANSVIRNSLASNEFRDNPGALLSDLCFQFKSHLLQQQTTISISDGVDMGICVIDKKKKKILYAGARNNLIVIRNDEIKELEADRWGISGTNTGQQMFFTTHELDVMQGDKFYLSTDGFADQFGGPKGKKLKQKQMKELIRKYSALAFHEQKDKLDRDFESWKGSLEQMDDVTLIGFELA